MLCTVWAFLLWWRHEGKGGDAAHEFIEKWPKGFDSNTGKVDRALSRDEIRERIDLLRSSPPVSELQPQPGFVASGIQKLFYGRRAMEARLFVFGMVRPNIRAARGDARPPTACADFGAWV